MGVVAKTGVWTHCMIMAMAMGAMIGFAQSGEPVRLIWDSTNVGNERYLVYRSTISGGPYQRLTAEPIRVPFYIDDNVSTGGTYFYVVSTVDKTGNQSPYSSEVKFTVDHSRASGFVSRALPDVKARGGDKVLLAGSGWGATGNKLTFQWTQVSGPQVSILGSTQASASFIAPGVTKDTSLVFSLKVSTPTAEIVSNLVQVIVTKR
jgi:hypothetical protein